MALISEDLFLFFEDLKENNTKEWFQANHDRFEGIQSPMRTCFIISLVRTGTKKV